VEPIELADLPEIGFGYDFGDQVRITGLAELVTDPRVRQEIWDET
jgi:general stress protein 26